MRDSAALKQANVDAKSSAEDVIRTFTESVANGEHDDAPYPHWVLKKCFPDDTITDILGLPFPAPSLDGVSGKRELHNATRRYFDVDNRKEFASVRAVAEAFQDKRITGMIEETFGTDGTIETKSSDLLAPLYADLAEAGESVAQAMGLDLILDLEQINPLFSSADLDVTEAVLAEFLKMR